MDPRFLSQFNPGTLPLPYSYDVCVTLDPSEREFAFLKPQHNVPVDSLIDADDPGFGNESLQNSSPAENLISQASTEASADYDNINMSHQVGSCSVTHKKIV
ncbi:unnamed protein product [Ranitomeya imitator]|uniref:Uncharacterized protein n=1 Tax=Ranitomeya imitator TaxID=111125 RepID=A0ABN9LC80_9NEOB|nr:unnamed protein product [Ranitomeya imitator]